MWCVVCCFFFLIIRLPPRSTQGRSSAASDVYKRQQYIHRNSLNSPVTQYLQRPNTEDDCLLGQYVFSDDIVDMFFRFIDDNHDELPSWIDQRTGFAFFYINNGE